MIVVGGWPARNVVGLNGRFGVRPAAFAAGGDFDNPFLNDVDSGDETTEFVGVVTALPSSGTVVFDDLGGFEHTGAADGTYSTVFDLFTWAQGGPVTAHGAETITTTFGSASTAPGVIVAAAAALIAGTATGQVGATAAGVTVAGAASLVAGTASGAAAGTAAGVTLAAAASLVAGAASGAASGTAAGSTLAAAVALIAGAASGQTAATAQGVVLSAAAALQSGAATGQDTGEAAGVTLLASASLSAGTAVGQFGATASGALLVAAAGLVPGQASAPGTTPPYAAQPETASSWSYLQTGTLWRLSAPAGWGTARAFATPEWFLCDYAADNKVMVSQRGDEFTTRLLIYTSLPGVKAGDMLLIGRVSDVDPVAAGAQEVKAVAAWADTFNADGPEDFRIAT